MLIEGRRKDVSFFGEVAFDVEDIPRVKDFRWHPTFEPTKQKALYAATKTLFPQPRKLVMFHRLVMDAPPGLQVDHINNNSLDNRKCNLRLVTNQQNGQNRAGASSNSKTGVRGVSRSSKGKRWSAQVRSGDVIVHTLHATFEEAEEAVIEYRRRLMTHSKECFENTPQNTGVVVGTGIAIRTVDDCAGVNPPKQDKDN